MPSTWITRFQHSCLILLTHGPTVNLRRVSSPHASCNVINAWISGLPRLMADLPSISAVFHFDSRVMNEVYDLARESSNSLLIVFHTYLI